MILARDTAKAIRGAYAATLELNTAKVRADRLSGAFASGDTTTDGTTGTGGRATDEAVVPGGAGLAKLLSPPVASVGNGADQTEDVLQTVVIPGNTLANVGDVIHIKCGGTYAGSTDNKVAKIRLNGVQYAGATGAAVICTQWIMQCDVQKTGPNAQVSWALGLEQQGAVSISSTVGTLTDTAPITLTITGQNITAAVAGSITCRYLTVEYVPV